MNKQKEILKQETVEVANLVKSLKQSVNFSKKTGLSIDGIELLLLYITSIEKQVNNLYDIISELSKQLEERYYEFKDVEDEITKNIAYEDKSVLDRINELKEKYDSI